MVVVVVVVVVFVMASVVSLDSLVSSFSSIAPPQRADAVGNAVHSPEAKIGFGDFSVPVPHFLAKAFGMTDRRSESSSTMEQLNEPAFFADDECYMGKEGNFDECVDFDPQHKASP